MGQGGPHCCLCRWGSRCLYLCYDKCVAASAAGIRCTRVLFEKTPAVAVVGVLSLFPYSAYTVQRPSCLLPLSACLLSHCHSWLITRRLRDLSLYNPTSTLDAESLAFSLFLHEANGANMMVEVGEFGNNAGASAHVCICACVWSWSWVVSGSLQGG